MTANDDVQTYDLTVRPFDPANPETNGALYADLTADQLAAKLSEHNITLPTELSRGQVTLNAGMQLIWEPVTKTPPTTPVEKLQTLVAFLKRTKLPVRLAGLGRVQANDYGIGFDITLTFDATVTDLLNAADHVKGAQIDVVQWDNEGSSERAMRLELRGTLAGVPIEIGYPVASSASDLKVAKYLRDNVPALAEITDHQFLTVPLHVAQAAANAAKVHPA